MFWTGTNSKVVFWIVSSLYCSHH